MPVVLLVDDDVDILKVNLAYLKKEGFKVFAYDNPVTALKDFETRNPDCVVLDRMMPQMDGLELCRRMKEVKNVPVILLTGKASEDDCVEGLMGGADDYLVKPYGLKELCARIRVQIRKSMATEQQSQTMLTYGPLTVHILEHRVVYGDVEIPMSRKEYDLFYLLAASPDKVFSFEEIGKAISGGYIEQDRRTIMVNASRLRKKIEEYTDRDNIIQTVWSKGYKFVIPQ